MATTPRGQGSCRSKTRCPHQTSAHATAAFTRRTIGALGVGCVERVTVCLCHLVSSSSTRAFWSAPFSLLRSGGLARRRELRRHFITQNTSHTHLSTECRGGGEGSGRVRHYFINTHYMMHLRCQDLTVTPLMHPQQHAPCRGGGGGLLRRQFITQYISSPRRHVAGLRLVPSPPRCTGPAAFRPSVPIISGFHFRDGRLWDAYAMYCDFSCKNMPRMVPHVPVALHTARSGARPCFASVTFSIESKEVTTPSTIGMPPFVRTGE